MRSSMLFNHGEGEPVEPVIQGATGAKRVATVLDAGVFDTLGTLAMRAYGHNSREFRDRIESANPNWKIGDTIHAPH